MNKNVNDTILQEFSRKTNGLLRLHLTDASYVRSDIIIFNRKDSSLYAVLEGASHFVGYADEKLARNIVNEDQVVLAAPHYHSGRVELKARVAVH